MEHCRLRPRHPFSVDSSTKLHNKHDTPGIRCRTRLPLQNSAKLQTKCIMYSVPSTFNVRYNQFSFEYTLSFQNQDVAPRAGRSPLTAGR